MKAKIETTCQICGRAIKANTGLIAHHGYTRPAHQWQTQSCEGARELPYERSCDFLTWFIKEREELLARVEQEYQDFCNNPPPPVIRTTEDRGYYGIKPVEYPKPDDFDPTMRYGWDRPRTYAYAYREKHSNARDEIAAIKAELKFLKERLAAWQAPAIA